MKRLVALFLLCMTTSAYAQGAAPFWEPLLGPPGPLGMILLPDSSAFYFQLGGAIYLYDTTTNSWTSDKHAESKLVIPHNKTLDYDYVTIHNNVWVTANGGWRSYIDSLFYSADSTFQWHFIGTFGTHRTKINRASPSIIALLETPSSHVVLVDDSGYMYITTDNFATMDTERIPEPVSSLFDDGDTLYLESIHGNLYRSTDFGKDWRMLLTLYDTASDWHLGMATKGKLWLLYEYELDLSSAVYSNVHLWYSLDRGNDWSPLINPAPAASELPTIDGIDEAGRMYLTFHFGFDSSFRTDDSGKTWHKLPMPDAFMYSFYVQSNGTLYAGFYRSLDQGNTWDTISGNGIACLPFDMLSFQSATLLSASAAIYATHDDGTDWTSLPDGSGNTDRLSTPPDSLNWLMLNTTKRLYPSGGLGSLCESNFQVMGSIGVITTNFHIWLASNQYKSLRFVSESTDTGCDYISFPYDTLSASPMAQVMEWAHDTILAVSQSGVYRGYDILIPFDTVTPEPGTQASPTGAMMKDSTGAIYIAMSDGKLFVTRDGANSWQSFASPTDASAPIISLTASPTGLLFAADSNLTTHYTRTWQYDPTKQLWENVTSGLKRPGFSDTAEVTNIWYVNGYAYAGTWNMGLFRSQRPVGPVSSVASAEHYSPFKLYPNPAGTSVTLQYPSSVKGIYRVVDMAGREALRGPLPSSGNSVTIDIHSLPNGMYDVSAGNGYIPVKLSVEH